MAPRNVSDRNGGVLCATTRAYAAVILTAVLARVVWILVVPVAPVSDSCRYDLFARNLAADVGYASEAGLTAYWPVGPSFLFSLMYRAFGWGHPYEYIPIAIMNLTFGAASVALTMYLGWKWFSRPVALAAGVLLALWPSQIQFTTVLASETPFVFLVLAALAIWCSDRFNTVGRGAASGVLLAAASFMRPTAVLLPVVFGFARLFTHSHRMGSVCGAALMGAVMIALILPWSFRNQSVLGEFVLISTNGGVNMWMGNNPETTGFYQKPPATNWRGEVERDRVLGVTALDYIRQAPWAFVARTAIKAVRLYERETIGIHWNAKALQAKYSPQTIAIFKWVGQAYWLLALALAVAGAFRLMRRDGIWSTFTISGFLMSVYFTLVHAVTVVQDRYHFAMIPIVAIFGGYFLTSMFLEERPARVTHATTRDV